MLKRRKFWKRLIILTIVLPVLLVTTLIALVYWNQERIVQEVLKAANEDFKGEVVLDGSHIAPFANFPYISIDLEGLKVYETKDLTQQPVLLIQDVYIGFDLWTLLAGNFDVKSIKLSDGDINVVEYEDGSYNIAKAFETIEEKTAEDLQEDFHFNLKEMKMERVDIHKINSDSLEFDTFFNAATISFKSVKEHLYLSIDSDFELSMLEKGDTTFLNRKPIQLNGKLDYINETDSLFILPSSLRIANVEFGMEGKAAVADDFNMDFTFTGQKPDFSLLIALAPDDLIPVLASFENRGDVYFKATASGKSMNGNIPYLEAEFGCVDGFFKNPYTDKVLDELTFVGYFTNGEERTLESMRFELKDFHARPETGVIDVNIVMENFVSPDIDVQLTTLFDLDYLAQFLNVEELSDLKGQVKLEMNFHDIIDLENPEKSIEKFNESYYTRLDVEKLGFAVPGYNQRIDNINISLEVDGSAAVLNHFSLNVGGSDVFITGEVSDLPAIVHHTDKIVTTKLKIKSNALDVNELTLAQADKEEGFDEYIKDLELDLSFESSAKALTESPYLPYGAFYIHALSAKLTNYPHVLHDFSSTIKIDSSNVDIIDFSGMIDQSDFHLKARLADYPLWFQDTLEGDTKIGIDLTSNRFQLKDIFSYEGENYVPEDYRDEELTKLKIHTDAILHFKNSELELLDADITELTAKMNLHPLKFERFSGHIHMEGEQLSVTDFKGKIGNTSFITSLNYYLGEDESLKLKENRLVFNAPHLDFDQLFDYEVKPSTEPVEHDSVFSIFDVPFPDMSYQIKIGKMNYHNYLIERINADMRTTTNHMLYIDTLQMDIAGGHMDISGYFNGSNRDEIYFHPQILLDKVNLDKLMLKFDNFGQDEVLSDNLHGNINGTLSGKIHMHADLVPIIDDSQISMDIFIVGGSVENYGPMEALSGYFEDEKLHKVIFDSLQNHIDLINGVMTIPEMVINSNLGFIVISGKQDMDMNMEYYLQVPLKMITSAGSNKLFGRKKEEAPDELFNYDPKKKYRFVNIKIVGDAEDFKVTLGKNKG